MLDGFDTYGCHFLAEDVVMFHVDRRGWWLDIDVQKATVGWTSLAVDAVSISPLHLLH